MSCDGVGSGMADLKERATLDYKQLMYPYLNWIFFHGLDDTEDIWNIKLMILKKVSDRVFFIMSSFIN